MLIRRRRLLRAALLLALPLCMVWFGPRVRAAEDPPPGNAMCPVMTDQEIDPEIWVEKDGVRVYFCCTKCKRLYSADPEKYAANLVLVSNTPGGQANPPSSAGPAQATPAAAPPPAPAPVKPKKIDLRERIGRFHIVTVHFPIALLGVGAFLDVVRRKGSAAGLAAVRAFVAFGALAALMSMGLGLLFEEAAEPGPRASAADHLLFDLHKWSGISAASLGVISLALVEWRARRPQSRLARFATPALVLSAIGVGVAGHFGGQMVWGRDFLIPW